MVNRQKRTQFRHCHFKGVQWLQRQTTFQRALSQSRRSNCCVHDWVLSPLITSPTWIRRSRLCREWPRLCSRELPPSSWTNWRKEENKRQWFLLREDQSKMILGEGWVKYTPDPEGWIGLQNIWKQCLSHCPRAQSDIIEYLVLRLQSKTQIHYIYYIRRPKKPQNLPFENLKPWNVWDFCLRNDWNN